MSLPAWLVQHAPCCLITLPNGIDGHPDFARYRDGHGCPSGIRDRCFDFVQELIGPMIASRYHTKGWLSIQLSPAMPSQRSADRKRTSDTAPYFHTYLSQCSPMRSKAPGSQASIRFRIVASFDCAHPIEQKRAPSRSVRDQDCTH